MKGILLNENNDLLIRVKRDGNGMIVSGLIVGENAIQSAGIVLTVRQGELKEDPIIGTSLLSNIRGKVRRDKIKMEIQTALVRANINTEEVKKELAVLINNQTLTL